MKPFTDNMSLSIKDLLIKDVDIVKSKYCFNLKTIRTATNELLLKQYLFLLLTLFLLFSDGRGINKTREIANLVL